MLANFYDLTQDDAPLAELPEVINLASSSDEEGPIARRVKRRTGRQHYNFVNSSSTNLDFKDPRRPISMEPLGS